MRAKPLSAAALISAMTAAVVAAGQGTLASPPLLHPAHILEWWHSTGTVRAVFSMLRLGAVCLGVYCVLLLLAAALAVALPGERAATTMTGSRLWGARRALGAALGASVTATVVASCSPAISRSAAGPDSSAGSRPSAGSSSSHETTVLSPGALAPVLSYVGGPAGAHDRTGQPTGPAVPPFRSPRPSGSARRAPVAWSPRRPVDGARGRRPLVDLLRDPRRAARPPPEKARSQLCGRR